MKANCTWCAHYSYDKAGCLIDSSPDRSIGICIDFQRRPTGAIRYPCKVRGVNCARRTPGCRSSCEAYAAVLAEAARRKHEREEGRALTDFLNAQLAKSARRK